MALNAFLPFVLKNILTIHSALSRALEAAVTLLEHLEVRENVLLDHLAHSTALANALVPLLGYDRVKAVLAAWESSPPTSWSSAEALLARELGLSPPEVAALLDTQNLTSYLTPAKEPL